MWSGGRMALLGGWRWRPSVLSVCLAVGLCASICVGTAVPSSAAQTGPVSVESPAAATIGGQLSRAARLTMKQIIHTDKAPAAIGPYRYGR